MTPAAGQDPILACVHCGFCLDVCPTYTRLNDEADSPRGRLYLMRALAEHRIRADSAALRTHLGRCLGCRACEPICPSDVHYGHLLERARTEIAERTGIPLPDRMLLLVFGNRTLNRIGGWAGRVLRAGGVAGFLARAVPRPFRRLRFALRMLAATRPAPLPQGSVVASPPRGIPDSTDVSVQKHDMRIGADVVRTPGPDGAACLEPGRVAAAGERVAMLQGCVQQALFERVNRATDRVLRAHGREILEVRGQGCCGALHAHAGDLAGARRLARRNVAAFDASGAGVIVVNAAGCSAFMKAYGELLEADPDGVRAERVASRVRDVNEYLVALGPRRGGELPVRVAYDAPCHLIHAQRIRSAPTDLLQAIPGMTVTWIDGADECCGGAGTWGLANPLLGGRILEDKVRAVRAAAADVVATPNPGCMMQIGAGLRAAGDQTPVFHPIELLAESYRRRDDGS